MSEIKIPAEDAWNSFNYQQSEYGGFTSLVLADDEWQGIEIFMETDDITGFPLVVACYDMEILEEVSVADEIECEEVIQRMYDTYLMHAGCYYNSEEVDGNQFIIEDREFEIEESMADLVSTLLSDAEPSNVNYEEIRKDLTDSICVYLYEKYDISVYRPMFLENKNGEKEFVEYPYKEMKIE